MDKNALDRYITGNYGENQFKNRPVRHSRKKDAFVVAHSFDALPGHVTISAHGFGGTNTVAICRAVERILRDERLKRKQIGDFKLSIVISESSAEQPAPRNRTAEYMKDNPPPSPEVKR